MGKDGGIEKFGGVTKQSLAKGKNGGYPLLRGLRSPAEIREWGNDPGSNMAPEISDLRTLVALGCTPELHGFV
jgi:hypothetical protein